MEGRGFCVLDDPVNGTATYADWPVHEQVSGYVWAL